MGSIKIKDNRSLCQCLLHSLFIPHHTTESINTDSALLSLIFQIFPKERTVYRSQLWAFSPFILHSLILNRSGQAYEQQHASPQSYFSD